MASGENVLWMVDGVSRKTYKSHTYIFRTKAAAHAFWKAKREKDPLEKLTEWYAPARATWGPEQ